MERDRAAASHFFWHATKDVPGSDIPVHAVVLNFAFFVLGCRGALVFDILLRITGACRFRRGFRRGAGDLSLGCYFPKPLLHLSGRCRQGACRGTDAEYLDVFFHRSFLPFSRCC